ncbi:VOC family protein [Allobranchiibius huperziae]|uniref:Putative enzyme related to lactoylglutathione lyase n=1 Tax=Allobranchiibius huperziae TaxID=1874116 RepID=A0A853DCL1_9MICO|nr:VOC family protein [Allobranchiibius huperziae]NYJ75306.1 putative enzyme related to lactoylglutathione lyase [Allobranchiibius huperziae]
MAMRWCTVVVDCHDLAAQARWWAQTLDWELAYESPEEAVIVPPHAMTTTPASVQEWLQVGPGLVFVQVPERKTVKNRLHIDLAPHTTQDRDAEIQALLDRGATRVDVGQDDTEVTWAVLADPEGNEFCVLSSRE